MSDSSAALSIERVRVNSLDIPQARDLDTIRRVIEFAGQGPTTLPNLMELTSFSKRHVHYRTHAARALGMVTMSRDPVLVTLTSTGSEMLATAPYSKGEAELLRKGFESGPLGPFASMMLATPAPTLDVFAAAVGAAGLLSPATARHRAQGLLAWRTRLLGEAKGTQSEDRQLILF